MKQPIIFKHLFIDYYSATPKYLQLANCIVKAITEGVLKENDVLPSINELSFEFEISRDTAEKGYKHLKKNGVFGSVPGKGYFVKNAEHNQKLKIFLLFNKLSSHKKIIYDSFVASLGDMAAIDFYIYNNDFAFFKNLIEQKSRDYTHFVIIPHFLNNRKEAGKIINSIPKHKLLLLAKKVDVVVGEYAAVYEHFEQDIYNALEEAHEAICKYKTIKIVFPEDSYFPDEILQGFRLFCKKHQFKNVIVTDLLKDVTSKGDLYITLIETDLVTLVERIVVQKIVLGTEVGIISYNETPIKKIIREGITTISTDFQKMGQLAAKLILTNSRAQVQVPFSLIKRPSL